MTPITPALETEIEDMGGTALEATDEAITFSRGDVAYAIRYGSGLGEIRRQREQLGRR